MRRQCGISIANGAMAPTATVVFCTLTSPASAFWPLDLLTGEAAPQQTIMMVALAAAMIFALFSTISLMRARDRAEASNEELSREVGDLRRAADRAEALVSEVGQRLVAWSGSGDPALMAGGLPAETGAPTDDRAFLDFAVWLMPESADRLLAAITALRTRGEGFLESLETRTGRRVEARGWSIGGTAAARFRDLTGDREALAELGARHDRLAAQVETMRAMLADAPQPVWLRDTEGRVAWVNEAYAMAVEARDAPDAVANALEMFDDVGRRTIADAHRRDTTYSGRLPAIVGGARRVYEVTDIAASDGSAGIAIDITDTELANAALRREVDFNARTLDQLQTAVAIFGPDRRLRSANAAYRILFDLDAAFLESAPDEDALLERMRARRVLPEQADFRKWRADLLSAYESQEARETQWHLPDGRTLRVIANPHPRGGMTWIYENVTERLDLESRYNALQSVQGETLDHLAEGVAVFGSNGRLRLHNPALAEIWGLDALMLDSLPHVSDVVDACRRRMPDTGEVWTQFTAAVAGLDESRAAHSDRMERPDGSVIDWATVPLPDGQTMVTFVDMTDSANVQKALIERTEALEAAGRIKNTFIRHVSYELRSPLTNIIGFAQLLNDDRIGPLNDKQAEYVGYVLSSSASLLASINDILDLTTVDAGVMELDLAEIPIAAFVDETIGSLSERIEGRKIRLRTDLPRDGETFVADEKRIRQALFNLLANAIDYSHEGGVVDLSVARRDDVMEFEVRDQGPGMPSEFLGSAFDRFSSLPRGGTRGGAGLGLAIVKSFVELHGGKVAIESVDGQGATVRMILPLQPRIAAAAAE